MNCRALPIPMFLLFAMAGCMVEEHSNHEQINPAVLQGDWKTMQRGLGVGEVSGCSLAAVRVLDQQIIDEMNCLTPDTLVSFADLNIEQTGTSPWPYLQPPAKEALRRAINARGATIRVTSIYRTIAQQYLLYQWYLQGRCSIGLAARPGRSNHQSGLALDTGDYNAWKPYLEAEGWTWLGNSDPVHFDYRGNGTRDIRDTAVLAFQRLWNLNNPGDRITEDGDYGSQTEARLRQSPADGFPIGTTCTQEPPDPAELHVSLDAALRTIDGQPRDLVPTGSSTNVFDMIEGQQVTIDVVLRNGTARDATDDIHIGFDVGSPEHLRIVNYTIETDHPAMDGQTWQLNDANDHPNNPDHANPGASGFMNLFRFSPGESKRITFTLEAKSTIFGANRPNLSVWIKHIGGYYGEMDSWDDPVEVNQAGELLRQRTEIDIFAPDQWEFQGQNTDDTEGWTACPQGGTALTINPAQGALEVETSGFDPCVFSPAWTNIDANTYKALSLQVQQSHGDQLTRLYWRHDGEEYDESRAIDLFVAQNNALSEVVADLSNHNGWTGSIRGLKLDPWPDSPANPSTYTLGWVRPLVEAPITGSNPDAGNNDTDNNDTDNPDTNQNMESDTNPPQSNGTTGTSNSTSDMNNGTSDTVMPDLPEDNVDIMNDPVVSTNDGGCATAPGNTAPLSTLLLMALCLWGARRKRCNS